MSDINDKIGELANAFEEFKSANEQKISSEVKGAVDVLTKDKLDRINSALTDLQAEVTNVAKKTARPGAAEGNGEEANYAAAFNKWARKGMNKEQVLDLEQKAMTLGSSTDGGIALPKQVESGLYTTLETLSPIRQLASVVQVTGDDYRFLSNLHGLDCNWVSETAARPETATPKLSETRVPMGEIYCNPAVSQRALDDLAFDVPAFIGAETARGFAIYENAAFVSGDGQDKPQGILTTTGITTVATGAAAAMPTSTDFIFKMIYTLNSAYRQNARFIGNSATIAALRGYKDGNGNYMWQPSLVAGEPAAMAGYAISEVSEVDGVAANKVPLAFGDIRQGYLIADRIGVRTIRDELTHKPFVHFYSTKRVGGMVKDKNAFVFLKVAAS